MFRRGTFVVFVCLSPLIFCSCSSTNPLVQPFDVALNETLGPYIESKLMEDLDAGKRDISFVTAKRLELEALRALVKEAKGATNE
jgi:hypothetical protein